MLRPFLLCVALAAVACSASNTGGSSGGSDASTDAADDANVVDAAADTTPDAGPRGGCAVLPTSAKNRGTGCTSPSGTFTEFTFDTVAGAYNQSCGASPYKDQADFDANEGASGAAGTVIKSNEDYVLTATCASGSISYEMTGTPKTTIVFLWTKAP